MDKKRRPSVMITTYASTCGYESGAHEQSATDSERSTEFFSTCNSGGRLSNGFYTNSNHLPVNSNKSRILYELNQIKGPSGSVRGHKDVVKKSLESIKVVAASASSRRNFTASNLLSFGGSNCCLNAIITGDKSSGSSSISVSNSSNQKVKKIDELDRSEYLARLATEEQDVCVAYTTSLGVIRRTFDDSTLLKSILNLNLIRYEERDIYLNQEYKQQLRLRCTAISVPALFVDGRHLGGVKELELLNESGRLSSVLAKFKMSKAFRKNCLCCGNARFIACQSCNGSRKSTIHHFKFNSVALRCIKCDRNDGLVPCPMCLSNDNASNGNDKDNNNNNNDNNNTLKPSQSDRVKL